MFIRVCGDTVFVPVCAILPCDISSFFSGVADLIDELMSSDGETEFESVTKKIHNVVVNVAS